MSATPIIITPGINRVNTPLTNESAWSFSNLVRFFQGNLQKLGGFARYAPTQVNGICRGLFANQDANNFDYLAVGTNVDLEIVYNGALYNITPSVSTSNLSTPFSTTITSPLVTIHDVGSNQTPGNAINIANNMAVGGLILQGFYTITSVTDADHYVITAASNAASTVTNGGASAQYTTTLSSSSVQVTLANNGQVLNGTYTAFLATTLAGITIVGPYQVTGIIDANNFTIDVGSLASSSTSAFDNSDQAQINYLIPTGNVSAGASTGYGLGSYGFGTYGFGTSGAIEFPRKWYFAEWNEHDFITSYTDGPLYYWTASNGVFNNPAVLIPQAPPQNTAIFLSMPQQQIIAIGSSFGDTQDHLLVRWCDVADYTSWTADITNQAGSFRIPNGSRIVGGLQAQQQNFLWTEIGLWVMQYIQPPYIYSFNEIAKGCGLIGSTAMGVLDSRVFWMGTNNFYMFDGSSVQGLACPVWDIIFRNLNTAQAEKIVCAINSPFNEVAWYFPSAGSDENDMYVKLNVGEGTWDYGTLSRTSWIDQSIIGMPIGAAGDRFIQQHEVSNDADGLPMDSWAETGWFKLSGGNDFIFIERMIPDFTMTDAATILITVSMVDYPNDTPVTKTFAVNSQTEYIIVRMRGRLASIKIESTDLGSFWRNGTQIYFGSEAGRR